jgi:pyruvate/2-oxoglutarate dehydrogenase complex dihydrolipoamide acyltransferase (E2) component
MPEVTEVIVPRVNPNDDRAVLVAWRVESGSQVSAAQVVATLETTKATFDVSAPCAGYVHFRLPEREMIDVGVAIAWITDDARAPELFAAAAPSVASVSVTNAERFTRKALRLMREHGLTADDFPGTDRIDAANVERVAAAKVQAQAPGRGTEGIEPLEQPASKVFEAATLSAVYRQVVPSSVTIALDERWVEAILRRAAVDVGPVSLMEVLVHAASRILGEFPEINGFYDDNHAWRHKAVHIGFAINAGRSLKVPVVREANHLGLGEVVRTVRELSLRYMRDELTTTELSGGTFTITDLSGHGVVQFMPVLNERQAAILGICAARPGAHTRDIVLGFDHRMSDGMRAAAFLRRLSDQLEGG